MIRNVNVGTLLLLDLWRCFSAPLAEEDMVIFQISKGCGGPGNQMQCGARGVFHMNRFRPDRFQGFGC